MGRPDRRNSSTVIANRNGPAGVQPDMPGHRSGVVGVALRSSTAAAALQLG